MIVFLEQNYKHISLMKRAKCLLMKNIKKNTLKTCHLTFLLYTNLGSEKKSEIENKIAFHT